MLPTNFRFWMFDYLSKKTMRYVSDIPTHKADGLVKEVYDMIRKDFFKNGSLTSRSKVPELMAAIWTGGRESMLVEDRVDRTAKDAMCAALSQVNDCPYCEDMLVSLVYAGGEKQAAEDLFDQNVPGGTDAELRQAVDWVRAVAAPGDHAIPPIPFSREQIPAVFGTIMAMSDINRFSHVVMDGSPVEAPFGLRTVKALALRIFGSELEVTRSRPLEPGRALGFLPTADLPDEFYWAEPNARVADAIARWAATVERETKLVVSDAVRTTVERALSDWQGEMMPISRSWVDREIDSLSGMDHDIAKLAIVLAKAPYQVDETMAEAVLAEDRDEERFVRILAWASFTAARHFTRIVADRSGILPPATICDDDRPPWINPSTKAA